MQSARNADRIVKPLLVYYGVLSLSRALILFLTPGLNENNLSQSHGLSVVSWGEELNRQDGDIASLTVRINAKGSFRELMEATGYMALLRCNLSVPNFVFTFDRPADGAEFTLGDMLARFPEIVETYTRWKPNLHMVKLSGWEALPDNGRKVQISTPYTVDDVKRIFGKDFEVLQVSGTTSYLRFEPNEKLPNVTDVSGSWSIGDLVVLSKLPAGIELSKISSYFCISYMLGMMVRYYPSHWISINHNIRFGEALPSLAAALEQIEEDFVRLVVEFLEPPKNLHIPKTIAPIKDAETKRAPEAP